MRQKTIWSSLFLLFFTTVVLGQITGKVEDEFGPLEAAEVTIKGSGAQTQTNEKGEFSIDGKVGDVLIITNPTTMSEATFPVKSLKMGLLKVRESEVNLDVVVGYGKQKRASVTGAITSVKGADLRMSSSSLTSSFAGQMAGVIATANSGEPGSGASFYIRGIGTFGGRATPLILLDDVEISISDLNNIPTETIESFSILKDASATAIYGSRGANGVMLVKTKSGNHNEKTRIGVSFEYSINKPVGFPNFVDGPTWMELYNEALISRNPTANPRFSEETINNTRNGVNPYVYPNVNWKDVLFRDFSMGQKANINIQGGGNKTTYYMSIQANHDNGLLKSKKQYSWNNNINRWVYNFQNNISYKLLEGTKIDLRMNAQIRKRTAGNYSTQNLFYKLVGANPIAFPITFPEELTPADDIGNHINFGTAIISGNNRRENLYETLLNSFKEERQNTINTSLKVTQDLKFITKGLSANVLFNFKNWSYSSYHQSIEGFEYRVKDGSYNPDTGEFEIERVGTSGSQYISQSNISKNGDNTFVVTAQVNYARKFKKHNLSGMVLYNQREFRNSILPRRNQSYSARLNYSYNEKYLAELSAGYTGTERLQKKDRFEFFPSISLGWVVSREDFFSPLANTVNFLKLRGSYGLAGSDDTGLNAGAEHFLYRDKVKLQSDGYEYRTGENLGFHRKGVEMVSYAVRNARWEKVKQFDIGFEALLFNKLNLTVDYFDNDRYDILLKREAWPQMLGYHNSKPWSNKGRVRSWGYDGSVSFRTNITSDLSMALRGNFTYVNNKYIDVDDPEYEYTWRSRTGYPLDYTYGYIAEGLFKSQEEIDNSPRQDLGSTPKPGDIKYRDVTGDGKITNDDQVMISRYGKQPRLQYGFGINLFYKKFDLNLFFNGSAKRTIMSGLLSPFGQGDQAVFQLIADRRWTENNPNPNAEYPRLGLLSADTQNNSPNSTYWMRDGSFLRFKTIEIGYKFKYGRVFLEGNNIALFSKFKDWDPELSWHSYPLQRTYNLGVQLHF
ncbi:TonB-dependent receptor [Ornithobacterium rhinotracheale]|uniref:SusC/RagA family TonB-linked outer membrane protein n=1 Tax=Ornithobacterium rhinotracheale TaxID=28251 RepID=UPI00129C2402|nr:TonB-dependent receptor [Ornithobacterium rhinotracheale]MRJ08611.1 TonB-dependent receptor [Ornithobacterium rhinotracheale]UOH76943.1 TonB-dependent receptor [Ornithobacterium rhinotracheale]